MKRPYSWLAAVIVLVIGGVLYMSFGRKSEDPAKQTQYKVTKASRGPVRKTVSSTGVLQPWRTIDIKSKAGGRVDKMLVDVGTRVKPGQVIAMIDPADTQLAVEQARADTDSSQAKILQTSKTYDLQTHQTRIAIANAQASVKSARANLIAASIRLTTAKREAGNQPMLTDASIKQARANYNQAVTAVRQLDATNNQSRASARSAYDSAVANETNARANLTRQKNLLAKGYVSQQAVDSAQASYDVAKAQMDSAKTKLDTLDIELKANVDAAKARVDQARASLNSALVNRADIPAKGDAVRQAKAAYLQAGAQVDQAQEALEQARANAVNNDIRRLDIAAARAGQMRNQASLKNANVTLAQTTVRAPSEGVVLTKYVDEGTIITSGLSLNSTGSSIVQLGDTTRMFVDVTVDETDIASVDDGQTVDVNFDAYPGVPFEGKVARIDPQAVVTQNVTNIHVRVEIDNSSPTFRLLKPGMNATCEFVVEDKEDVLAVPSSAIQTDDNGTFVQIAQGGKPAPADEAAGMPADPNTLVDVKLTRQPVEVGTEGNDATEIASGLKEGQTIVVETIEPQSNTNQANSPFGGGRGGGRPH